MPEVTNSNSPASGGFVQLELSEGEKMKKVLNPSV
jgi:hypothetical protein